VGKYIKGSKSLLIEANANNHDKYLWGKNIYFAGSTNQKESRTTSQKPPPDLKTHS